MEKPRVGDKQPDRAPDTGDGSSPDPGDSAAAGHRIEIARIRDRIDTIAEFPAIEKYGVKGEGGASAASAATLAELAEAIAAGELVVPIQRTYPLDDVRAAFTELEAGHMAGKIVLIP